MAQRLPRFRPPRPEFLRPDEQARYVIVNGIRIIEPPQGLGLAPLAVAAVAGKVGGAVKKLTGMGPDPAHHADRMDKLARAFQMAQSGDLRAFLYLRARTGGFNAAKYRIAVPPIPELGEVGGFLTHFGDDESERTAERYYKALRPRFPQVPEKGNQITSGPSVSASVIPSGPVELPAEAPSTVEQIAQRIVTAADTVRDTAQAFTQPPAPPSSPGTQPPPPAPKEAGLGGGALLVVGLVGGSIILSQMAGGGSSRRRRRRR